MFIGAYLCGSGLIFLVTLFLLTAVVPAGEPAKGVRQRLAKFTFLSLGFNGLGLILFLGLSTATGILTLGDTGNHSLPQDYLEYGLFGWSILIIATIGILAPALTAMWLYKHSQI